MSFGLQFGAAVHFLEPDQIGRYWPITDISVLALKKVMLRVIYNYQILSEGYCFSALLSFNMIKVDC